MKATLALIFFFTVYAVAGTMDFNDKVAAAEENKELRSARIWSKKCERQGKRVLAKKSDSKPWEIHCVNAEVKV